MGSEVQESKEKKVEGSEQTTKGSRKRMLRRKRERKEQQQESSKKQRMEEDKESDEVDEVSEDDEGELMKHLVIKNDEDIAIDAIPLATKLPVISFDYKLHIKAAKAYGKAAKRGGLLGLKRLHGFLEVTTAQIQDYALWEVIENGDSWVSVPQTTQENGTSVTKMSIPVTAEEKTNKKNDVKARSLLLMALPNEHQLTSASTNYAKINVCLPLQQDLEASEDSQ
ncbi:hypothetical protein Tco_1124659 [Tanacetum coccineum]|uniref:Uncharacterized protein n=1 Tax=Tanacetum coccineum TaxID=301880 RepID=A0ABQ5J6U0_9ASTR